MRRIACTCPNCKNEDKLKNTSGSTPFKKKEHICHIPGCNKVNIIH
jgi:hypothetical protein